MPLLRVRAQPFGVLHDHLDGRREHCARDPPNKTSLFPVYRDEIGTINRRIAMGAYCTLDSIRRHPARLEEIMEVRRLFTYYDAAMFGDRDEIACIPHKGCLLEIVAAGEAAHPEVNRLLPGHVIRYTRSFFFGDRFELPSGTRVGLAQLVGFKLQLAPPRNAPLPEEEAIVQRATREKLGVTETDTAAAARR
jgi:hypothetical protein